MSQDAVTLCKEVFDCDSEPTDKGNFCSQQTCQALVVPVKIEKEIALRGYQHMLLGKEKEIVNLPKKQHLLTKSLKIRS